MPISPAESARIRSEVAARYAPGKMDVELAREIGCTEAQVRRARKKLKLPVGSSPAQRAAPGARAGWARSNDSLFRK